MNDGSITPSIGNDLFRLRSAAKKSQGHIAEELRTKFDLRIDPSRLSRIESGQVTPTEAEMDKILQAIGTREAEGYRQFHQSNWIHSAKPSFWHPDRPSLALAEETLGMVDELARSLEVASPLRPQVDLYEETIRGAGYYLRHVTHDVVPMGRIAVGKSTATAALTGLVLPDTSLDLEDRMVLETGQGRTTIGEVAVCRGREYAIRVEPYTEGEIRQLVRDFCAALFSEPVRPGDALADREEGVGEEIERALRNMSDLNFRYEDGERQQRTRSDPAVEFLNGMATTDERRTAFMNRLDLPRRTATLLRHDPSQDPPPLEWLKETFQEINHGRRPDVSLPRRIDVQVPDTILGDREYELRWVDTKGVDQTTLRPDLQKRLEDPRSLLVLCSGFAEAPGETAQSLIEHAVETGLRSAMDHRAVILTLPHAGDARKMKDPTTLKKVRTEQEGYDEKARQVADSGIYRKYSLKIEVLFLNAASEADCQAVSGQLRDAIRRMRRVYAERIAEVAETVRQVRDDLDRARTEAAQREVNRQLQIFLRENAALTAQASPIFMGLIRAIQTDNAQSVKASVRRRGDWYKFDIYLHLATWAARDAQTRSDRFFNYLDGLLSQMQADSNLALTHRFLSRLKESAVTWREQFVAEVRRMGGEIFRPSLEDSEVWQDGLAQRAPDYRGKVAKLLKGWFEKAPADPGHLQSLEHNIQAEWECQVLSEFRRQCGWADTSQPEPAGKKALVKVARS